jgi:hypothetical protein
LGVFFFLWSARDFAAGGKSNEGRYDQAGALGETGGGLLVFSKREFGCEQLAVWTEIGYLQYVAPTVGVIERQSESISAKEILPVLVVCQRISHVDVGPHGDSLTSALGGTLYVLVKLETKDARCFDLRAEWVEQTDVKVYPRPMCLIGRQILGQRWNVDSLGGVACTGREVVVRLRRWLRRRGSALAAGIHNNTGKREYP